MPTATYTNKLVTPPANEPVTLQELKQQLDIPHNGFNDKITAMGKRARQYVESQTSRAMVEQTWLRGVDCFPVNGLIELPTNPVQTVDEILFWNTAGTQQPLDPGSYRLNNNREPAFVELIGAMPGTEVRSDAVTVKYVAGYTDTSEQSYGILKDALLMWVDRRWNDPEGADGISEAVMVFLQAAGFGDEFATY